jgi:hypothetical protein
MRLILAFSAFQFFNSNTITPTTKIYWTYNVPLFHPANFVQNIFRFAKTCARQLRRSAPKILYISDDYLLNTSYPDCTSLSEGKHSWEVYLFGTFQIRNVQGPRESKKHLSLSNRRYEPQGGTGVEGHAMPNLRCPA